jgi:hypothetical protein
MALCLVKHLSSITVTLREVQIELVCFLKNGLSYVTSYIYIYILLTSIICV